MKKEYRYQTDVIETIYDCHNCLLFTVYDDIEKDTEGYNAMLLVCQIPNREQVVLEDTEENRDYCMYLINKSIDW